ncbi:hypothetical protein [Rhodanobacter sp. L36]|uniref:hypothetical protein n=1 Tax=Rhodanobacter sp. L36 TaxID=1747221 RepID=UPI00131DE12F|nr:hypothetical protein [Rhodanobacter sp. L36]
MHKLVTLFCIAAALTGCNRPDRTIVMRSNANGTDSINSRVTVFGSKSTFACVDSRSGQCHYSVFAHACTEVATCDESPVLELIVAAGQKQSVNSLPTDFQLCVNADAAPKSSQCLHPDAAGQHAVAATR